MYKSILSIMAIVSIFLLSGEVFGVDEVITTEPIIDTGASAWMLISTALVLLMVPGLAIFYAGLVRAKNVLSTMMHSFVAMGIMTLLWIAFGYSMAFGSNILGGWFGWNSDYVFLKGIDSAITSNGIPEYVFAMFQGKFAIITPALIAGAFAERVYFRSYCLFIALWGIIVYNPLCHWVWAEDGFLFNLGANGAIDFAGGTVVHISAGVAGLVSAIYIGPRRGYPKQVFRPSNLSMTMLGVGLLWVGWFGFNAGSSLSSGLDAARALTMTQIAAASGAIAWMIIEGIHHGKATSLGLASGILAGLVAITPAAGVVQPIGAIILGLLASLFCYLAIIVKQKLGYDDTLDVFGIHGVGGIAGALLLSFFIRDTWLADAAASTIDGSWSNIQQFGIQLLAVGIAIAYSAILTYILLLIVDKTFGFRSKLHCEMRGIDDVCHSEQGYGMLNS